jgi:hypothetical protein
MKPPSGVRKKDIREKEKQERNERKSIWERVKRKKRRGNSGIMNTECWGALWGQGEQRGIGATG